MHKVLAVTLLCFFIAGTFVITFNSTFSSEITENSWYTKKSMSQARTGLGVVAVDGKIYAIGGGGVGGFVGINERYDPKLDVWVTLEAMPTPRMNFGIVAYDGKIYCIGSATYFDTSTSRVSVNEVYDIATDSWSTKAPLPFAATNLHAQVVDGKIFVTAREASLLSSDFEDSNGWIEYLVANGRDPFSPYPDYFYMYDPVTDVWTQKTCMPTPFMAGNFIVSAVVDGKIFFAGEFEIAYSRLGQKVLIYDPKTDEWSEGTTGFMRLWCGSAGVTSGVYAPKNLYALGISSNNIYDPVTDVWSSAKAMPTERANFGVAVVDDILYVIGGSTSNDFHSFDSPNVPSALNEQYIPLDYRGALPSVTSTPLSSVVSSSVVSSSVAPTPSDLFVSSEPKPEQESELSDLFVSSEPELNSPSESVPFLSFLFGSVGLVVVLSLCVVVMTLFFIFTRKKKKKQEV
ncbi:MAG: hypothetical protein FWD52_08805 [Candidatus Bathyarchaeota archaeon]|nr:hypothetical protein [Candidatus Termiticorpusculum sp.]